MHQASHNLTVQITPQHLFLGLVNKTHSVAPAACLERGLWSLSNQTSRERCWKYIFPGSTDIYLALFEKVI